MSLTHAHKYMYLYIYTLTNLYSAKDSLYWLMKKILERVGSFLSWDIIPIGFKILNLLNLESQKEGLTKLAANP